jgi:hypothetical protein
MLENPFRNEELNRRAVLNGAMPRPQSRPYLLDTSAPCVLASHSPRTPRR